MDSKHQENYLKKYDEKSLERLQSRTVFADPTYQFIFKKTEKVVAALYLITNLISDTEPIKSQIRELSLKLISDMLSLKRPLYGRSKQDVSNLTMTISEIATLLKVAHFAEYISSMNFSIMQKEFALLVDSLQNSNTETFGSSAVSLSQDFFNVPTPAVAHFSPASFTAQQNFSSKGQYRTSNNVKDNQMQQETKDNLKDSRQEKIIQSLKAGKSLGIKDFAREIKDCSEKTIQRELLTMVEKGVLKKTGERRWSLYSLT